MSISAFGRGWFIAAVAVWMAMAGGQAQAQDVAAVNAKYDEEKKRFVKLTKRK